MNNKNEAAVVEIVNPIKEEVLQASIKIKENINLSNNSGSLFGSELSAKLNETIKSDSNVKSFDEIGEIISNTFEVINKDPFAKKKKGLLGLITKPFSSAKMSIQEMHMSTLPMRAQITKAEKVIIDKRDELLQAVDNTRVLIDEHIAIHDELHAHIIAGHQFLEEYTSGELEEARLLAEGPEGHLYMNDYMQKQFEAEAFETRLNALEQAKNNVFYTVPELQVTRRNDASVARQLTTIVEVAIPSWITNLNVHIENQRTQAGVDIADSVTKATNELMIKTSNSLKDTTFNVNRIATQDVIKMETFEIVHKNLIEILGSTQSLNEDIRKQRIENIKRHKEMAEELINLTHTSDFILEDK